MNVFEDEEKSANHGLSPLANIMRETWESGSVWFWHSIMSISAMYPLFIHHICPRFAPRPSFKEEEFISKFWCEDAPKIVQDKADEYDEYKANLERLFTK
jgi:hypothetical protein